MITQEEKDLVIRSQVLRGEVPLQTIVEIIRISEKAIKELIQCIEDRDDARYDRCYEVASHGMLRRGDFETEEQYAVYEKTIFEETKDIYSHWYGKEEAKRVCK